MSNKYISVSLETSLELRTQESYETKLKASM